jgi:hypothetical protein
LDRSTHWNILHAGWVGGILTFLVYIILVFGCPIQFPMNKQVVKLSDWFKKGVFKYSTVAPKNAIFYPHTKYAATPIKG